MIIRVKMDVALTLHQHQPATIASNELLQVAEELSVILKPMHPNTRDPHLAQYFMIEVPDREIADRVIVRLLYCKAIEAAYLKPPDEVP